MYLSNSDVRLIVGKWRFFVCNCVKGLKTGMYYLRTRPAANAIQFTVDKTRLQAKNKTSPPSRRDLFTVAGKSAADNEAALLCSLENKENCLMCSGWAPIYLQFSYLRNRWRWRAQGFLLLLYDAIDVCGVYRCMAFNCVLLLFEVVLVANHYL